MKPNPAVLQLVNVDAGDFSRDGQLTAVTIRRRAGQPPSPPNDLQNATVSGQGILCTSPSKPRCR
jgi:hypothetical protein